MQEQDSDRLEEFFRKATARPDVSFNEEDWKKLEARLDAGEGAVVPPKGVRAKVAGAVLVAALLLLTGALWLNARYEIVERIPPQPDAEEQPGTPAQSQRPSIAGPGTRADEAAASTIRQDEMEKGGSSQFSRDTKTPDDGGRRERTVNKSAVQATREYPGQEKSMVAVPNDAGKDAGNDLSKNEEGTLTTRQERYELTRLSPAVAVKIKQKAVVDLPGAEEEDARGAQESVIVKDASVQKEHSNAPRLSLLLLFAPDFSTTSLSSYSGPGTAYGGMVEYSPLNRWSVSAGMIKNDKKYTSAGEYYNPPQGYWKRNTNGIIPSTIDGSCAVLEFPLIIRYTMADKGSNRWTAGAGASSYLMQSEAYQYNFEDPNPGAKSGWKSRGSSRFFFNMINFTIAYEHRLAPGFMVGIEPYVKIPVEAIGWSNLKLFSTGASVTMRYALLRKRTPMLKESRPPN